MVEAFQLIIGFFFERRRYRWGSGWWIMLNVSEFEKLLGSAARANVGHLF